MLAYIAINIPFVQNWLVKKVAAHFSEKLQTRVTVKHVSFSLFNKMNIEGFMVEDRKKDTLLYAGTARVNLTDWFFLKDKITLKYIGLKDAVINMNRTDSVWNYQFLVDYFSSQKKTSSKKSGMEFNLKILELENVRINKIDKWLGQNMIIAVKKLTLRADIIDYNKKQLFIASLDLNDPVFAQFNYSGAKPRDTLVKIQTGNSTSGEMDKWVIHIKNLQLTNATFINDKQTARPVYPNQFDASHLQLTGITGSIKNLVFAENSLTAELDLAAKERSGFEIKKLQTKFKFAPDVIELGELLLETNKSRITNYYAMRYNNFNEDLKNFIEKVTLDANFVNTVLHSDDIAYFAPSVKSWNRSFTLTGNVTGAVSNISAKNILIKTGNTMVDGNIALHGLPDIKSTFIDFTSHDLQTNYRDLVTLVPALRRVTKPQLNRLGNIRFRGNFTGFINDFVAFGNISTSLGNISADLNMKLPVNSAAIYSGKIATAGFNLGQFLNNKQLGNIALNGKVTGKGFSMNQLDASFDGTIHQLEFSGYNYQNIAIQGNIKKKVFEGALSINDPNLKIEYLEGMISFANEDIELNFDALLQHANLQKLRLVNENVSLSGHFNVDFAGTNIDDFLGTARMYNATLIKDSTKLSFDSLTVTSLINDSTKMLTFQSNEFEGEINGDFKVLQLPDAFKLFLNKYYPTYIEKPTRQLSNQDFSFLIRTKQVDEYIQALNKKLRGFNNSVFSGSLKLGKNELDLHAEIPEFSYDGRTFTNIFLESSGNLDSLFTTIAISDIALTDSLHLPNTQLTIISQKDISDIRLRTSASKTLRDAQLNARIQTLSDGIKIDFFPSSFIINDKKWELEKNGNITIRKSYIEANDVRFVQGEQEIVISTELDELTDHTNLLARLRNVNINDFTSFFIKQPRLEGVLTGNLTLKDPFGKQVIEFEGNARDFRVDDKMLGNVNMKGDVNTATGLINLKADADGELYQFNVNGSFNYKDSTASQMNIDFMAERFEISILNNYLGTLFSDMQGNAKSNLKISGGNGRQYIVGSVTITEGALKVNYTQCKYKFTDETITFNPDEIDLGTLQLKDTLNNPGTVSGKMQHRFFQDFQFNNLRFETDKMLLLNTNRRDNSQFYGKLVGRALLTLDGPVTNMKMDITGEPSIVDTSHIFLPTGRSKESGTIDYIDFIQFGTKMEDEFTGKKTSNLLININLTANPACQVDVVLDEETGDVIKGRGNGQLNIRVGTREPMSMRGNYEITEGNYTFNFQTFLRKPFTIKQGSIVWDGDPLNARIDITAEYLAKKVDISSISTARQKEDITIIAHITGYLNKPVIAFDFRLPPNSDISKDYFVIRKLEDIKSNKTELYKQVASLLLVNSFITTDQSFLTSSNTIAIATNTIGGVLSGWLANLFNKELEKATNGLLSTYFDINSSLDLQNKAAFLQANVSAGLKIFLSSRLVVLIGGNLDYNNPYAQLNKKGLLTPDINIEWLLNKDGSLRVVGFNRTSVDLTFGQRNRSGIKLSYRKDFDSLSDLFRPSEEKRRRRLLEKEAKENSSIELRPE